MTTSNKINNLPNQKHHLPSTQNQPSMYKTLRPSFARLLSATQFFVTNSLTRNYTSLKRKITVRLVKPVTKKIVLKPLLNQYTIDNLLYLHYNNNHKSNISTDWAISP